MPPKRSPQSKPKQAKPKSKPKPTPERRRRQRNRRRQRRALKASGARVRKMGGISAPTALSMLGSALASPSESAPLRFPTLTGRSTDVKHIYIATETETPGGYAPGVAGRTSSDIDVTPTFGGKALSHMDQLAVLTRDPIAPMFLTVSPVYTKYNPTTSIPYHWWANAADGPQRGGPVDNIRYYIDPPPGLLANQSVTITPPESQAVIAPLNLLPRNGADREVACIDARGNCWDYFGGGVYQVTLTHYALGSTTPVNIAAGAGVYFELNFERYLSDVDTENLAAPTDPQAGDGGGKYRCRIMENSSASTYYLVVPNATTGFLRLRVSLATYSTVANAFTFGPVAFTVARYIPSQEGDALASTTNPYNGTQTAQTLTYSMIKRMSHPVVPTASNKYLYDEVRVTATSMLITNTTPEIYSGGDIFGAQVPEAYGIHVLSTAAIDAASGKRHTGYRGRLLKGGYTWMQMPEPNQMAFRPSNFAVNLASMGTGSNEYYSYYRISGYGVQHAFWCHAAIAGAQTDQAALARMTFQVRVDQHIEFISQDQLAMLSPSPFKPDDALNASKALGMAPLFTENWAHLDQLWGWLKASAGRVLAAGGRAVAGAAMAELASGLSVLAL